MMQLPKFIYTAPAKIREALSLLEQYGQTARILAGGTDLLVAAKLGNCVPGYLISLKRIKQLRGISYREKRGLSIGAMTTLHEIRGHPYVRAHYPVLAQATGAVGTPQIRRMGTVGGNLTLNTRCYFYNQSSDWREHRPACLKMGGKMCHAVPGANRCFAVSSADIPPALMALNARLRLMGRDGERLIPVHEIYSGDGKEPISLAPGEIITQIQLPPPNPGEASIYLKYRIRRAIDFPLAGVAARVLWRSGTCIEANVILNAVGPMPFPVREAEAALQGSSLSKDTIAEAANSSFRGAHPVANTGSTPSYRKKMAGVLTMKALITLSRIIHSTDDP